MPHDGVIGFSAGMDMECEGAAGNELFTVTNASGML
jgi:hypothetical protein